MISRVIMLVSEPNNDIKGNFASKWTNNDIKSNSASKWTNNDRKSNYASKWTKQRYQGFLPYLFI